MQIRSLETELGVTLFHRVGKRLVLAPQGEVFLAGIEAVFNSLDEAVQSVSTTRTDLVRVSIAIGSDLARYFSGAIAEFVRANPGADLSMCVRNSPEVMALVANGTVDIGVGYFSTVSGEFDKHVLTKSGLSLVCSPDHPLAGRRNPALDDIAKYRLITLPPYTSLGGRVARAFSRAGVEVSGTIEGGSCQTSQELAEKGLGVAIIHTVCVDDRWPRSMRSLDLSHHFGSIDVAIIHRKSHRLAPAHSDFIRTMLRWSK
jgi:DNA-binding transcriptional LysR family regulator